MIERVPQANPLRTATAWLAADASNLVTSNSRRIKSEHLGVDQPGSP